MWTNVVCFDAAPPQPPAPHSTFCRLFASTHTLFHFLSFSFVAYNFGPRLIWKLQASREKHAAHVKAAELPVTRKKSFEILSTGI